MVKSLELRSCAKLYALCLREEFDTLSPNFLNFLKMELPKRLDFDQPFDVSLPSSLPSFLFLSSFLSLPPSLCFLLFSFLSRYVLLFFSPSFSCYQNSLQKTAQSSNGKKEMTSQTDSPLGFPATEEMKETTQGTTLLPLRSLAPLKICLCPFLLFL